VAKALKIDEIKNSRDMRKTVLSLVWPIIVQNFLITLFFITDTMMVGRLGEVALSAVGIAGPILWSTSMVLMAVGIGTMASVARAVGEGDSKKAEANAATGLLISLVGGIAISILGTVFAGPMVRLFMTETDVVLEGEYYFAIIMAPFALTFLGMVASSILRAAGDTRTPMLVGIVSNCLNIVGNYVLIFGKFGFPEMGLAGAGIATALSRSLSGLLLLIHVFSSRSAVRIRFSGFLLVTKETVWRVVKISIPAAIEPLFVHSGFLMFTKIVAVMGTTAMAAHRVAIGIESLGFMAGDAFYMVAATIVGQSLGANRKDLAEMGTRESMKVGLMVMSLAGVVFLVFPGYLARMFTDDLNLVSLAAMCLMLGAIEQPFMAVADVFKGAFQGAGDTKTPAIVGAISVWSIRVPVAYLLAVVFGLGLAGVWITTALDWALRTVIFFFIYRRGKWKDIKI